MTWFESLAQKIENHGGKRLIFRTEKGVEPQLYLERYYIIKCPAGELMLHRFHLGDLPIPHDHPFDSRNIILKTGYYEHVYDEDGTEHRIFRKPGYIGQRSAEKRHYVELAPGTEGDVWTIFATSKRRKDWGFYTEDGYVDAYEWFEKTGVEKANQDHSEFEGWLFPSRKIIH